MIRVGWTIVAVLLLVCVGGSASAQESRDLAGRVLGLFETKCTECHGSQVPKPKGNFGYVTDLARVADNPLLVVPGEPLDSEIYLVLVDADEELRMPPGVAREGGLSADEIDLVRAWIEEGAPTSITGGGDDPLPLTEGAEFAGGDGGTRPPGETPPPKMRPERWQMIASRLHPLLVHFPIALVLSALLAELLSLGREAPGLRGACRYCIRLAAVAAPTAAFAGWWAGELEGYKGFERVIAGFELTTLDLHRWSGVVAGALPLLLSLLEVRQRRGLFRLGLLLTAALIGFAGYHGGGLVHGEDHLRFW